jgi:hypothetical protein
MVLFDHLVVDLQNGAFDCQIKRSSRFQGISSVFKGLRILLKAARNSLSQRVY